MSVEPTTTETDGFLPAALTELETAVAALCDPISVYLDNQLLTSPSLYLQLRDAVTGEQSNAGTGGGSKSRPPFWTDAFDVLNEIDTALEFWQPQHTGVPPTVGRMRELLNRPWRPQDCRQISDLIKHLEGFANRITTTLFPQRKFTLPNPCPNCSATEVRRPDAAGEAVRQSALQITNEGCKCLACKYVWGIERFQILAAAIQQDTSESRIGMTAAELIAKLSRVAPDTLVVTTDSTSFRYITEFTARTVQARITEHHSIGRMVQQHKDTDKEPPVHVIVLSHQKNGNEL